MRIQKKLQLSFMVIASSAVIAGLIGLNQIITIKDHYTKISRSALPQIQSLENLRYRGLKVVSITSQLIQLGEGMKKGLDLQEEWVLAIKDLHSEAIAPLQKELTKYSHLIPAGQQASKEQLEWIQATAETLVNISTNVIAMRRGNNTNATIQDTIQMMEDVKLNFQDAIDSALKKEEKELRSTDASVADTLSAAKKSQIISGILIYLLATVLGAIIARSLARPIKALVASATALGKGLLTTRASEDSQDEIGALAHEFNLMADNLAASTVSKEHVANMLLSVPNGLFILNAARQIEQVNPAAINLAKYSEEELIGRQIESLFADSSFVDSLGALLENGPYVRGIETDLFDKERNIIPVSVSATILKEEGQYTGLLIALEDITQRKKAEEQLYYLANYDALTELPNRILLIDRLDQILARINWRNRMLAVLFCDLDSFKLINDTCGHNIGDVVLKNAAKRLSSCVRSGDTVARHGGDEFVVILNDMAHTDDALNIAQKIINTFTQPFEIDGQEFFVSVSIGISLFPEDGLDAITLLKNADTAMSRAKELGKNGYQLFSPLMNSRAQQRLTLERELHHALEHGEIVAHYQPQYDADSGEVVAMEALVRWHHPQRGLVSPGEFLPVAMESGLIVPLGERLLRSTCQQCSDWLSAGLPVPRVAFNLSDKEFKRNNLIRMVRDTLHQTRLPPNQLEIELTEDIFIQDLERAIDTMQKLKDMGIQLSVDDFGTGYSSFSQLKRFPINTLKIDRSFIVDICVDENDATITAAIIAMAHTLNLSVIAEGVENEAQKELLQRLGCRTMQGYLFSRPLSPNDMQQLLERSIADEKRYYSL